MVILHELMTIQEEVSVTIFLTWFILSRSVLGFKQSSLHHVGIALRNAWM
jgi:hypothetical protein